MGHIPKHLALCNDHMRQYVKNKNYLTASHRAVLREENADILHIPSPSLFSPEIDLEEEFRLQFRTDTDIKQLLKLCPFC